MSKKSKYRLVVFLIHFSVLTYMGLSNPNGPLPGFFIAHFCGWFVSLLAYSFNVSIYNEDNFPFETEDNQY